jgi:hypothetical protein
MTGTSHKTDAGPVVYDENTIPKPGYRKVLLTIGTPMRLTRSSNIVVDQLDIIPLSGNDVWPTGPLVDIISVRERKSCNRNRTDIALTATSDRGA